MYSRVRSSVEFHGKASSVQIANAQEVPTKTRDEVVNVYSQTLVGAVNESNNRFVEGRGRRARRRRQTRERRLMHVARKAAVAADSIVVRHAFDEPSGCQRSR